MQGSMSEEDGHHSFTDEELNESFEEETNNDQQSLGSLPDDNKENLDIVETGSQNQAMTCSLSCQSETDPISMTDTK